MTNLSATNPSNILKAYFLICISNSNAAKRRQPPAQHITLYPHHFANNLNDTSREMKRNG